MIDHNRIKTANEALKHFHRAEFYAVGNTLRFKWTYEYAWGETRVYDRPFRVSSNCYPLLGKKFNNGSTAGKAIVMLARWIKGQPVLPIRCWQYWCIDQKMGNNAENEKVRKTGASTIVELLTIGGYPQTAQCAKCGQTIDRFDWNDSGKVHGPAHFFECPEV